MYTLPTVSYFEGQDKNVSLHFSVVRVHLAEKMTLMATRPIGRWLTMAGLRHGRYCIGVDLTFFCLPRVWRFQGVGGYGGQI